MDAQNQQGLGMQWGLFGGDETLFGVQKEWGTFWSLWQLKDDHGHRVPWDLGII